MLGRPVYAVGQVVEGDTVVLRSGSREDVALEARDSITSRSAEALHACSATHCGRSSAFDFAPGYV